MTASPPTSSGWTSINLTTQSESVPLVEAYRGLAILTTNMKSALDTAFLRRIRFVVHFPFPDLAQRAAIWSRVFPSATPMSKPSRISTSWIWRISSTLRLSNASACPCGSECG